MAGKTDFSALNASIQADAERKNNGGKKFEKIEWLKFPFGDTNFTVLPPRDDNSELFVEVYVHHNNLVKDKEGNDVKRSVLCTRKKYNKCPICDRHSKLTKEGLTKEAYNIRGQRTLLCNALDINGNQKVAPLKPAMFNEVRQEINAYNIDNGVDVTDPLNRKQIKLSRLKALPWARARVVDAKFDATDEKLQGILNKLVDLTKVYIDNTPEELQRLLSGEDVNAKARKDAGVESSEEPSDDEVVAEYTAQTTSEGNAVITGVKKAPANSSIKTGAVIESSTVAKPSATRQATKPVTTTKVPKTKIEVSESLESTGDPELDEIMAKLGG